MKTEISYDKTMVRNVSCDIIPIELYKAKVMVFFKKENDELEKYWESIKNAGGLTQDYVDSHGDVFIRFPIELTPEIISHEATHASECILKSRGVEVEKEQLAYLVGHITGKVHLLAKKKQIRIYNKMI